MPEPNPFAFTGPNVPQLRSSDASLRAELARLKQHVVVLQPKVQDLEDANGVAQTLAAAKNQVQDSQRETKRAQIAERVAREALDAVRNTSNMSQASVSSQDKAEKLLSESKQEIGKLQVELETCKGLPDNASESLGDTSTNRGDSERVLQELKDEFEARFHAASEEANTVNEKLEKELQDVQDRLEEAKAGLQQLKEEAGETEEELETVRNRNANLDIDLQNHKDLLNSLHNDFDNRLQAATEDANTTIAEQQAELQRVRDRLDDATTELQQMKEEASEAKTDLKTARNDNAKLDKALAHQKDTVAHLSEINDHLLADLAAKEAERKALARDRDDFEVRLTKTLLALKEREEGEAEARNALESFVAETELVADGTSEQITRLQGDVDTYLEGSTEHARVVAVKDERIAKLERENEILKNRLEEGQAHNPVKENIPRPITYRNISIASHKSLAEELDLDDDQSIGGLSDFEESATNSVCLELSAVRDIISIAPHDMTAPKLTVSVSDAVSTTPRRPASFMECSPVSSVSSIQPAQPTAPTLSVYNDTVADLAPSKPVATTLSLFEETVLCISPIEPATAPLAFSDINEALDYAPFEPTISPSELPAPTLSLSDLTVESVSPSQPSIAPLLISNVQTALDYAPAGPAISASTTIPEPQKLSLHAGETLNYAPVQPATMALLAAPETETLTSNIFKHAFVSLDPDPSSGSVTDPHAHQACDKSDRMDSKANRKGTKPEGKSADFIDSLWWQYGSPCPSLNSSRHKNLGADPEIATSSLRRRSPIDAFAKLPEPSGTTNLDELSATWPLEDEPIGESAKLQCAASTTTTSISPALESTTLKLTTSKPTTPPFTPTTPGAVPVAQGKGLLTASAHYLLHFLMVLYCWHIWSQLHDWEHANGVGLGEGYGNVHNGYGPYGNGRVLLGMLPINLLSADSPLPAKAVEVITSTVSAFEGLIGLGPTPLF
ncbi:hypothetical protein BU25DRAFT_110932 [Macroventuria anomochaeta]|uniref:Uncharacterized protein n=1 Tax=Macroventuria anomochaeta TaxID=301207 RepID=A0ACB6RXU9_9PLEO|nr:uncharacterized protein BU25DRAFT_110932 [Macroventuria anomochaeta]KAF2625764.1 hypothetical protein BU25DRAFT_110932 [Macroventuria anomochaeta]